jgi:hypothetical protein
VTTACCSTSSNPCFSLITTSPDEILEMKTRLGGMPMADANSCIRSASKVLLASVPDAIAAISTSSIIFTSSFCIFRSVVAVAEEETDQPPPLCDAVLIMSAAWKALSSPTTCVNVAGESLCSSTSKACTPGAISRIILCISP